MQEVFGPVIKATQEVLANVSELNLKVDLPKCASTCTKTNENQVFFNSKGCKIGQWSQIDHCREHSLLQETNWFNMQDFNFTRVVMVQEWSTVFLNAG